MAPLWHDAEVPASWERPDQRVTWAYWVEVTGRYSNRHIAEIAAKLLNWALDGPG